MIISTIKFFTLAICNFIFFTKALSLDFSHKKTKIIFLSFVSSLICVSFNQIYGGLDLCVLCIMSPIVHYLLYKLDYYTLIVTSLFSLAITMVTYYIALFLTIPVALTLGKAMKFNYLFDIISELLISTFCILIIALIFKIKRFSKGLDFLYNKKYLNVIAILACGTIFLYIFFRFGEHRSIFLFLLLLLFITFFIIFLYLNTKKQIADLYFNKQSTRMLNSMTNECETLKKEIFELKETNIELSKIIHKDNKLLSAIELTLLTAISTDNRSTLDGLLKKVRLLSNERNNTINKYEHFSQQIADFDYIQLTSIINYMNEMAYNNNVVFNFTCVGQIEYIIPKIISESDLSTLIADIVENAIISARTSNSKSVLLTIHSTKENCYFSVYDTGDRFDKNVIKYFGKKRYTTHKDTGGSGIGLMTTFELLKKYNASFSIDETTPNAPYTKCVSIVFDNNHSFLYNNVSLEK